MSFRHKWANKLDLLKLLINLDLFERLDKGLLRKIINFSYNINLSVQKTEKKIVYNAL